MVIKSLGAVSRFQVNWPRCMELQQNRKLPVASEYIRAYFSFNQEIHDDYVDEEWVGETT